MWAAHCTPEASLFHESASEVAAFAAEPPEAVSTSELFACPATAMKAVHELTVCPVKATEAVHEHFAHPVTAKGPIHELSACPVMTIEAIQGYGLSCCGYGGCSQTLCLFCQDQVAVHISAPHWHPALPAPPCIFALPAPP